MRYPFEPSLASRSYAEFNFTPADLTPLPDLVMRDSFGRLSPKTSNIMEPLSDAIERHAKGPFIGARILPPTGPETGLDIVVFCEDAHIALLRASTASRFGMWMAAYWLSADMSDVPLDRLGPMLMEASASEIRVACHSFGSGMPPPGRDAQFGQYLVDQAPNAYRADELAAEKRAFLARYVDTSGQAADTEALATALAVFAGRDDVEATPPISEAALANVAADFEAVAGFALPAELLALFAHHAGVEHQSSGTGFLGPKGVLREYEAWLEIFNDPNWPLEELTNPNNITRTERTLGLYTSPYWVPFYSTGGGNFLCVDYCPNPAGRSGQVIAMGADDTLIRLVAENVLDFLQQKKNRRLIISLSAPY